MTEGKTEHVLFNHLQQILYRETTNQTQQLFYNKIPEDLQKTENINVCWSIHRSAKCLKLYYAAFS